MHLNMQLRNCPCSDQRQISGEIIEVCRPISICLWKYTKDI